MAHPLARRLAQAYQAWLLALSGQQWTSQPTLADRLHFAEVAAYAQAITDQRRLTAVDHESLRAAVEAGISPNAALIDDLAKWTGMPNDLLQNYLNALRMVTPLLTGETIDLAEAVRQHYAHAAANAGSAPGDPTQGIPDPAGLPADGAPVDGADLGGLGGLTLESLADGIAISVLWVAILDWKDLVNGEIELVNWLGQRVMNATQNQVAIAIGSSIGMAAGPIGAVAGAVIGVLAATAARAAYRTWQGERDNLVYQAEREACDAAFGDLCRELNQQIGGFRTQYRADCARALAGMPEEGDYPDIRQSATATFTATRNAVLLLPRRRQFPGHLTARQRHLLRAQLRRRRDQWLGELDAAARDMAAGKFLDALYLTITINRALVNQFDELITVDWAQLSTGLSAVGPAWENDRKAWLRKSMQGVQQSLATYQNAADKHYRAFLAEKEALMQRRLKALLTLVNGFRKRRSRRPLRSTSELLDYIRSGRTKLKAR